MAVEGVNKPDGQCYEQVNGKMLDRVLSCSREPKIVQRLLILEIAEGEGGSTQATDWLT